MIDLRSDTVTRPSDGMRDAMHRAEVGDDVFGEDPTVNRLQETVANLLGKEAALLVPSGVMANQIAVNVNTNPGDELIGEYDSHIVNYETGATAILSGVQIRTIHGDRGIIRPDAFKATIRTPEIHVPTSKLLCIENTHNKAGGVVYPLNILRELTDYAHENGLNCHLDGARLWNASISSGHSLAELAAGFDTVSVCLSKGMGAPAGSLLAGSHDSIAKARRTRKMLGGGMRQSGVLAAAGMFAIDHHLATLHRDHEAASVLANGLSRVDGISLDPGAIQTNIVLFDTGESQATDVCEKLSRRGVLTLPFGPHKVRAVTHRDISIEDAHEAVKIAMEVL